MSSSSSSQPSEDPLHVHHEISHPLPIGQVEVPTTTASVSSSTSSTSSIASDRTVRPARVSSAEPSATSTSRSSSIDSVRTVLRAPISDSQAPTATASQFYFKHCNVCEQDNPNYVGCNHPEDVPPFQFNTATMSAFASSEPIPKPTGKMLSAKGLRELFNENVDDVAKGIFLTTLSGYLLGTSRPQLPQVSRACSLGTLTWRTQGVVVEDPAKVARGQLLKIVHKEAYENGDMKKMVVECDGRLVAMHWVFEKLIVGVAGEEMKQDGGKVGAEEGKEDGGEGEEEDVGEGGKDKNEGHEEEKDEEEGARKLLVKAEAMAEHLKEELKGFKMPSNMD